MKKPDPKEVRKEVAREVVGTSETSHRVVVTQNTFSGPLPAPEVLQRYDQIVPNGAQKIFAMAEREQAHRFDLDRAAISLSRWGQIFAFLLALVGTGGGVLLVAFDKPVSGLSIFIGSMATLVGAFVWNKKSGSGVNSATVAK